MVEGTAPWIHRPPSVISISIAKLTKISTDLILMRIILFRDKVMRMGLRHIQKKTFPQNLILPRIIGQDESFPGAGVIKEKTGKPLAVITVI